VWKACAITGRRSTNQEIRSCCGCKTRRGGREQHMTPLDPVGHRVITTTGKRGVGPTCASVTLQSPVLGDQKKTMDGDALMQAAGDATTVNRLESGRRKPVHSTRGPTSARKRRGKWGPHTPVGPHYVRVCGNVTAHRMGPNWAGPCIAHATLCHRPISSIPWTNAEGTGREPPPAGWLRPHRAPSRRRPTPHEPCAELLQVRLAIRLPHETSNRPCIRQPRTAHTSPLLCGRDS
jgi:hypothetical protein